MASKIDWANVGASFKKYWRIIAIAAGLLALLLFITWFMDACPSWLGSRKIDKLKENVNATLQNANLVNANIANLMIENRLAEERVNRLAEDYNAAKNASDQIKTQTNAALANVNAAERANLANVSYEEAKRKRCQAFPDSPECR